MSHLTLAERVRMMHAGKYTTSADLAELLADIAAADRLARATVAVADAAEQVASPKYTDLIRVPAEWNEAKAAGDAALAAYRARMADIPE